MLRIAVQERPTTNVVKLFTTNDGAPAPMPETNRSLAAEQAFPTLIPTSLASIDLHQALIRGLIRSEITALEDGRVVLEVVLESPGRPPEILQILMNAASAVAMAPHLHDAGIAALAA